MSYPFIVFFALMILISSNYNLYSGKNVLSNPDLSRCIIPSIYFPLGRGNMLNRNKSFMSIPIIRVRDKFRVFRAKFVDVVVVVGTGFETGIGGSF